MATKSKRPPFAIDDRITLASHMSPIPAYFGKPFVGRDTVLRVARITGRGTKRAPWGLVVADDAGHTWYLDPADADKVGAAPGASETCKFCKHRASKGFDGLCPSCANERAASKAAQEAKLDREIAHHLAGRVISPGLPGEDLEETGHLQARHYSYARATPRQVVAKLGADHVAWILGAQDPALSARSRADGQWHVPNLELMSAYERLAALIDEGRIAAYGGLQLIVSVLRRATHGTLTFDEVRRAIGGDPADIQAMLDQAVERGLIHHGSAPDTFTVRF